MKLRTRAQKFFRWAHLYIQYLFFERDEEIIEKNKEALDVYFYNVSKHIIIQAREDGYKKITPGDFCMYARAFKDDEDNSIHHW